VRPDRLSRPGSASPVAGPEPIAAIAVDPIPVDADPSIGCVLLRDVRFFPPDATVDAPPEFAPSVVQGKTYDLADPGGRPTSDCCSPSLLETNMDLDLGAPGLGVDQSWATHSYPPTGSVSRPFRPWSLTPTGSLRGHRRQDQTSARGRPHPGGLSCRRAPPRRRPPPTLPRPYPRRPPATSPSTTHHRLLVSPALRSEFGNGEEFYRRSGPGHPLPPDASTGPTASSSNGTSTRSSSDPPRGRRRCCWHVHRAWSAAVVLRPPLWEAGYSGWPPATGWARDGSAGGVTGERRSCAQRFDWTRT